MKARQKTSIFSYSKNTDLHCFSADMTLKTLIGTRYLQSLNRFQLWEFSYEDNNDHTWIPHLLNNSFLLVNHNKEAYFEHLLPEPKVGPEQTIYYIKVTPKEKDSFGPIIKKIKSDYHVESPVLTKSVVWQIILNKQDDIIREREWLKQKIVVTSTIQDGLLVDPLTETYVIMNAYEYSKKCCTHNP